MPKPIERAYGWQVRWKHASIDDGKWQQVAFRHDEGQTIVDANTLCGFLDAIGGRVADADEWIISGRYRYGSPNTFLKTAVSNGRRLRDLIRAYEAANIGRAPRTKIQMAQRQERYFKDWFDLEARAITTKMLNTRWTWLRQPKSEGGVGLKPASARAMMCSVIPILRYGLVLGWYSKDPIIKESMAFPLGASGADSFEEPLTEKEYYALLDLIPTMTFPPGMDFRRRHVPLTAAEVLTISLEIMGECGLRIGEVLGLAVEDIDLDAGVIHVDHHMVGYVRTLGTKAGPRRRVGLTDRLKTLLAPVIVGRKPMEPLLPAVTGKFLTYNTWKQSWNLLVKAAHAAGFLRTKVKLRPHLLRHSFATWMAMVVPALVLMEVMGHARITTTQRYYRRGVGAIDVARAARDQRHVTMGRVA